MGDRLVELLSSAGVVIYPGHPDAPNVLEPLFWSYGGDYPSSHEVLVFPNGLHCRMAVEVVDDRNAEATARLLIQWSRDEALRTPSHAKYLQTLPPFVPKWVTDHRLRDRGVPAGFPSTGDTDG